MQRNEKLVLGGIVAFVGALVAWFVSGSVQGMYQARQVALDAVQKKTAETKKTLDQYLKDRKDLTELEGKSLPTKKTAPKMAQALYNAWLIDKATEAGLTSPNVTARAQAGTASNKDGFDKFSFDLTAVGSLDQITTFLHSFYSEGMLHKIHNLVIQPADNTSGNLKVQISIEGLALLGTKNNEKLPEVSGRLKDDAKSYIDVIGKRNIFLAYIPPQPPQKTVERPPVDTTPQTPIVVAEPPPVKPRVDYAHHTVMSAVLTDSKGLAAFIDVRPTGEKLLLHAGDEFQVGTVKGKVEKVTLSTIQFVTIKDNVEIRRQLDIGQPLDSAHHVGTDEEIKAAQVAFAKLPTNPNLVVGSTVVRAAAKATPGTVVAAAGQPAGMGMAAAPAGMGMAGTPAGMGMAPAGMGMAAPAGMGMAPAAAGMGMATQPAGMGMTTPAPAPMGMAPAAGTPPVQILNPNGTGQTQPGGGRGIQVSPDGQVQLPGGRTIQLTPDGSGQFQIPGGGTFQMPTDGSGVIQLPDGRTFQLPTGGMGQFQFRGGAGGGNPTPAPVQPTSPSPVVPEKE